MNPTLRKKPSPEQIKKIAEHYTEMRKKITHAGDLVLKMARHPDITSERLMEVAAIYKRCFQGLRDVHESCRKNIGGSANMFRPHPWEKPL